MTKKIARLQTTRKVLLQAIEWLEQQYDEAPHGLDLVILTHCNTRELPSGLQGDGTGMTFHKLGGEQARAAVTILIQHKRKLLAKLDVEIAGEIPQQAGECPSCRGCLVPAEGDYKCLNCDRVFSEDAAEGRGAIE